MSEAIKVNTACHTLMDAIQLVSPMDEKTSIEVFRLIRETVKKTRREAKMDSLKYAIQMVGGVTRKSQDTETLLRDVVASMYDANHEPDAP